MCPIHFLCVFLIVRIMAHSSPIITSTSSFVICSVQLIFSILLHIHFSKASSLFISSFLMDRVSDPYSTTLHIRVFIIRNFPLRSSPLFSYRYPSFNFSVAFGIRCHPTPQIAELSHLFYFSSFNVYFDKIYTKLSSIPCHPPSIKHAKK